MSAKVMGMVFERYPTGGGEMLLALKLADNAHDDGTRIFPSVATMATRTRQSERAVQYQLRRMQKSGWLVLVRQAVGGRGQSGMPAEYRINEAWINGAELAPISDDDSEDGKGADSAPNQSEKRVQDEAEKGATGGVKGANDDVKGCKAFAPEPSVEPSVNRKGTVSGARGTRLPDDWVLTKALGDWALVEQPTWNADHVRRVAEKFKDYWGAKAGEKGRKTDWDATWRNWVRNESALTTGAAKGASGEGFGKRSYGKGGKL
ncbi:hypothetical protein [Pandoraea commovens]|nr:hypothetical protein [Pandoraea commovens]